MGIVTKLKNLKKLKKGKKESFYRKFIGILLKNGKKSKAIKTFDMAFSNACVKTKKPLGFSMKILRRRVSTVLEIKQYTRGKRKVILPFFANKRRYKFLTIRSIIRDTKEHKLLSSLSQRLSHEITRVILKRPSRTIDNIQQAAEVGFKNKSFIHYRWK